MTATTKIDADGRYIDPAFAALDYYDRKDVEREELREEYYPAGALFGQAFAATTGDLEERFHAARAAIAEAFPKTWMRDLAECFYPVRLNHFHGAV